MRSSTDLQDLPRNPDIEVSSRNLEPMAKTSSQMWSKAGMAKMLWPWRSSPTLRTYGMNGMPLIGMMLSLFYFVDQCLALGWSLVGICNTACRGCESAVLQCTPAWLKKRANGKPPAVAPSIKVEKNAVAVAKRCSSHCIRNKALCISPSKSTSVSPSYSLTSVA